MTNLERIAHIADLRYAIRKEGGTIGMITNGLGSSMALNDLITSYGETTANYLDLFGDSSIDDMEEGLKLMEFDKRVKCIVVNVFGGIFDIMPLAKALIAMRQTS